MRISNIQTYGGINSLIPRTKYQSSNTTHQSSAIRITNCYYCNNISFRESNSRNVTIPDIDYEEYVGMSESTKKRLRKRYKDFSKSNIINKDELVDNRYPNLPLHTEESMDDFIKISSIYSKYKDNPIICLGRSPKWFLNAALWMEDGIKDYKFTAFSGSWYKQNFWGGVTRVNSMEPTEAEIKAYRKYLQRIKADPQTIVNNMHKNGTKTIITDYIHSGKGACSFLEIMGNYAKDLGILEEFSKSIEIVGIGSLDYLEIMDPDSENISIPRVPMPEVLKPYWRNINQEFYNMDYNVFCEMLLNQNSNECRSTYYPHSAWTIYKPDQFKTGLVKDLKKVKEMVKLLPHNKSMTSFSPAMRDYRNLLNFRILDGLNARGLLKKVHKSKI